MQINLSPSSEKLLKSYLPKFKNPNTLKLFYHIKKAIATQKNSQFHTFFILNNVQNRLFVFIVYLNFSIIIGITLTLKIPTITVVIISSGSIYPPL